MFVDFIIFIVGLVVLYFAAEWLVKGSSAIALRMEITPLIVGCTVVAFGTSAPELVVSLAAVLNENDGISVGNIIGSNIANLALILGVASMIRPMEVQSQVIKREYPVMLVASLILVGLAYDGNLTRLDGGIMLAGMTIYLGYMIVLARRSMVSDDVEVDLEDLEDIDPEKSSNLKDAAMVGVGIIGLAFGAKLMVDSAVSIATVMKIPELVIGISVVAIGTSLPELATSAVAAIKGESDISVGNVIGSNVFNIFLVLGCVATITPISVGEAAITYDLWIMIAVTLCIWPIMWSGGKINRLEGGILVIGYFAYMVWLFLR